MMQILSGIILLGVLITFHELGHFLFAKWLGVRVLVFSIGFGPKLIGFRIGETEYRLSAIPLGGYVRMFGESLDDELSPEEKNHSFMHQAIWRKSLIAFAGPLFNFILPVILFFVLLVGHEQVFAPRVGTLLKDGVAEKSGILPDDLIVAVDGQPVESFNQVAGIISGRPQQDMVLRIKRKEASGASKELDIVVRPESKTSNNPMEKDQAVGRIGIMPAIELPLLFVEEKSPFYNAGLRTLDEVKSIDHKNINSAALLEASLADIKPGSHIIVIRQHGTDQSDKIEMTIKMPDNLSASREKMPVKIVHNLSAQSFSKDTQSIVDTTESLLKKIKDSLVTNRGIALAKGVIIKIAPESVAANLGLSLHDKIVSLDGEEQALFALAEAIIQDPLKDHVLGIIKSDGTPMVAVLRLPEAVVGQMGIDSDMISVVGFSLAQVFKPGELIERSVGPYEALKRACLQTWDIVSLTGKSFVMLVTNQAPTSQIGGPIMLFDIAQKAASKGLAYYIFIMCLLSVNLGLLNLLPIPALDGGHLLMFGIEAVQRKPLTARTRAIATQIGITILLLVMALAVFNDLARLFK